MRILFVLNYFGLHGSAISLLAYANDLKAKGYQVFFVGCSGFLLDRFKDVANNIHVLDNKTYLPSIRNLLLYSNMVKRWDIDVIIGVGKFKALETQLGSLLILRKTPIAILNFSRPFHWMVHKSWHIPIVGYLMVNSEYYREIFNTNYNWPSENINLLSARYEIPASLPVKRVGENEKKNILFVRRLDYPKYKSIIATLDQIDRWDIWNKWNIKIAGGGTREDLVMEAVKKIRDRHRNAKIEILGKRTDVINLMCKADIVIGSERVAVEAISQGCLILLAADNGLIDLITPDNIDKYSYDNFFGYNYKPLDNLILKDKLDSILKDQKKAEFIINGNFDYIKKHLDVKYGSEILSGLIQKSIRNKLSIMEIIKGLLKILLSWGSIYLNLFKDKLIKIAWNRQ